MHRFQPRRHNFIYLKPTYSHFQVYLTNLNDCFHMNLTLVSKTSLVTNCFARDSNALDPDGSVGNWSLPHNYWSSWYHTCSAFSPGLIKVWFDSEVRSLMTDWALYSLQNALTTHLNLMILISSSLNMAAQSKKFWWQCIKWIPINLNVLQHRPMEHELANIDITKSLYDPFYNCSYPGFCQTIPFFHSIPITQGPPSTAVSMSPLCLTDRTISASRQSFGVLCNLWVLPV